MEKIREDREFCEDVEACDETRMFCVREDSSDEGYADIQLLKDYTSITQVPI